MRDNGAIYYEGENGPLPLFSKKISNLSLIWTFLKLEFAVKLKFQKLEFFEKIYFKFAGKFFMLLEFMELEYHGKLNFAKLKDPKSDRFLHISEIMVDCNIVCKKVLFGYFRPTMRL